MARGGVNAGAQGEHGGQQHRHQRQRNGERQPLRHQLEHRRAVRIAVAELAMRHAADPMPVALERRAIQPQPGGQRAHRLGRRVRAHHGLRGVARQYFEHQKYHDRGPRQGCDQRQQALEQEKSHGRFNSLPSTLVGLAAGRREDGDNPQHTAASGRATPIFTWADNGLDHYRRVHQL